MTQVNTFENFEMPKGADSIEYFDTNLTETSDETIPNRIALTEFIQDFGEGLMKAVSRQNPPIFDGNPDPSWDAIMTDLKRQPFPAQRERVQAICRLLLTENQPAAVLNGEMGTGKTMMGIATAAVMSAQGYRRILVIAPPHLVYKWRREILETIENAHVWVLNGPDTLRQLLKIRLLRQTLGADRPEFFILGRVRMRMGFDWRPAAITRKYHNCTPSSEETNLALDVVTSSYAACPDCGVIVTDDVNVPVSASLFFAQTDKRRQCRACGTPLWSLVRNGSSGPKSREDIIFDAICKIPTIGPKTAQKLVDTFSADILGGMLDDNVYDFINLMDAEGNMVFSDRQANRMEHMLAKREFGFGQGGYQPSEFIKRYLPQGYFDLLLVDEGHEYKNHGSAQGQAMGVLAAKARKVVLLTGTLMGGYADDLFHLLWRIMPQRMLEDGFGYNAANSLGAAAMAFMRLHGVLKDVYKETDGGSHRTAKGKRVEVHTSKAPGFGPKGVTRYVLPYTAFLKLNQIGDNVLPDYREDFIDVAMSPDQADVYGQMSRRLNAELKEALRKGDKSLLGLVLSAMLAWPDTCFKEWKLVHPRTRDLLFYSDRMLDDDETSAKEQQLIELCRDNQREGRKVLVYTVYTGKHDTSTRLQRLLQTVGFKAAVLRSTVSTESREDWILDQVDRGIDVLICNPELVKTGLDLLDFPTICFMQTGYSVYTVQQAARRSWRIGQKHAVRVTFLGYADTAQITCLQLMAKKIAVSQSTSGDMPDTGLDVLNSDGDSIEVALAKQLLGKASAPAKPGAARKSEPQPKRLDSSELHALLAQCYGTEQWYRHRLVKGMLYTDGVQCFAEHGGGQGAYWFVDIVATEYWPLLRKQAFLHIVLSVTADASAIIKVDDGNSKVLAEKSLDFTDMQPGDWHFYLTDNVLLLRSEY